MNYNCLYKVNKYYNKLQLTKDSNKQSQYINKMKYYCQMGGANFDSILTALDTLGKKQGQLIKKLENRNSEYITLIKENIEKNKENKKLNDEINRITTELEEKVKKL